MSYPSLNNRKFILSLILTWISIILITAVNYNLIFFLHPYSHLPAHFASGLRITDQIVVTGHLLRPSDFAGHSFYASQMLSEIRYPIIALLTSMLSIVLDLNILSPLFGTIVYCYIATLSFLILILYATKYVNSLQKEVLIIIALFFAFAINYGYKPYLINSPISIFICLLIMHLLLRENNRLRINLIVMLVMILMIINSITYFTPNAFLIMVILFALILKKIGRLENNILSTRLFLIISMIYLVITIYVAPSRIYSLLDIFRNLAYGIMCTLSICFSFSLNYVHGGLLNCFFTLNTVGYAANDLSQILSQTSVFNKIKLFIILSISLAPFIVYIAIIIHNLIKRRYVISRIDIFIIPMFAFGVITYILGSQRLTEWAFVFANLFIISLLPIESRKARSLLPLMLIFAVFSSYVFITDENNDMNYITTHEEKSIRWFSKASSNNTIFTDFRTSAPFIYLGHYKTVGPYTYDKTLIDNIYYNFSSSFLMNDAPFHVSPSRERIRYFFVSREMLKDIPGIRQFDWTLRGIPPDVYHAYFNNENLSVIYSNYYSNIFLIK